MDRICYYYRKRGTCQNFLTKINCYINLFFKLPTYTCRAGEINVLGNFSSCMCKTKVAAHGKSAAQWKNTLFIVTPQEFNKNARLLSPPVFFRATLFTILSSLLPCLIFFSRAFYPPQNLFARIIFRAITGALGPSRNKALP